MLQIERETSMSKNDSKMIQGISVMAMVCLHLLDTLEFPGLFTPLLFFRGIPLKRLDRKLFIPK